MKLLSLRNLPHRGSLAALAAVVLLGACGSAPPAPVDRFYRLQTASPAVVAKTAIDVRSVRAESLYAERPIIFTSLDDPRQLRQYHYHLWLYPPSQMVREHLLAHFGNTTARGAPVLDARIVAFERVLDGRTGRAVAVLDVAVSNDRGNVLQKRYRGEQPAGDDSFTAFAAAMEKSLQTIYDEVQRDIGAVSSTLSRPAPETPGR